MNLDRGILTHFLFRCVGIFKSTTGYLPFNESNLSEKNKIQTHFLLEVVFWVVLKVQKQEILKYMSTYIRTYIRAYMRKLCQHNIAISIKK